MTAPTHHRDTLSIDQQLALRTAAVRLSDSFRDMFGTETIERFLHSSYDEFAGRAVVLNYLPLLAERFARQRLTALAKVEGKAGDGVPVVLFLCTHNAGRSQMAMGFFGHYAGDRAVAWSGGSEPGTRVNPAAVEAMRELGVDISGAVPQALTAELVAAADLVVTLGREAHVDPVDGTPVENWDTDEPSERGIDGIERMRLVRDDITARVAELADRFRA